MNRLLYVLVLAIAGAITVPSVLAQHVCEAPQTPFVAPTDLRTYGGDYSCDPAACQPPHCLCASTDPPGGIGRDETPQFLLLTYDDCIDSTTNEIIEDLEAGLLNPDGRLIPSTYFVNAVNCWGNGGDSNAEIINQLYQRGNEIASHTFTHSPPPGASAEQWQEEFQALDNFLVNEVGLDPAHINGFRAPWVVTSDPMFEAVQTREYTYEASLFEQPLWNYSMSTGAGGYVWPHTLDHGTPISCGFFSSNECPSEGISGLWAVPLYFYVDHRGEAAPPDSMYYGAFDPGAPMSGGPVLHGQDLYDMLWWNFEQRLSGNRAPLNMYLHASQLLEPERRETLNEFMSDVLAVDGVWAVTMQGLIEWMMDPVPVSQMEAWYDDYCDRYPCMTPVASETGPESGHTLAVYPNPASDQVTFQLDSPTSFPVAVEIYDILGRRVLDRTLEADAIQEITVSLSGMPAGPYVYRIRTNEKLLTGRITLVP